MLLHEGFDEPMVNELRAIVGHWDHAPDQEGTLGGCDVCVCVCVVFGWAMLKKVLYYQSLYCGLSLINGVVFIVYTAPSCMA